MNARTAVLSVALVGAGWLAMFGDRSAPADIAQPTRAAPRVNDKAPATVRPEEEILALIPRATASSTLRGTGTIFGQKSWAPPPPPPVAIDSKPTAPPLPYQYIGKKWQEGQWTVYLAKDDITLLVKAGDVLDDTYRVQSIDAARLVLHYIPLEEEQAIAID